METIHLDTHAVLWFYGGRTELLSKRVLTLIDKGEVFISPAVLLEIEFLRESGRIDFKVDRFVRDMYEEMGMKLAETPFVDVALQAVRVSWTRDPFDRMIVAQALAEEATLVTRDRVILKHCRRAVWD